MRAVLIWLLLTTPAWALSVTTSEIVTFRQQADGRMKITERHTFDDGVVVTVTTLHPDDGQQEARMLARAPQLLEARLVEQQREAEQALVDAAQEKVESFLDAQPPGNLQSTFGMTKAESDALKKSRGVDIAEGIE